MAMDNAPSNYCWRDVVQIECFAIGMYTCHFIYVTVDK